MDDFLNSTGLGLFIGALAMILVVQICEPKWIDHARKAKAECEENIPRKESCIIIALPKSKD